MSKIQALITKVEIKADAQGNAPSAIELLRTGDWHTPWHGDFEITIADLHEFAANFAKGIGLVEADKRAPINYAHEAWNKAAGWITSLAVDEEREALVASVEWTPEGAQGLKDKEWAYISPEFNPRGCPWSDAEGTDDPDGVPVFVNNVLSGAALTNIPLFKKLKPITASRLPNKPVKADATGDSEKRNQGEEMKLEDIRAKAAADLTDEEKAFLEEHKSELTADELKTLGMEEDPAPVDDPEPNEEEDPEGEEDPTDDPTPTDPVEASTKGVVSISASELASLKASAARADQLAADIDREKVTNLISASVKAGQIKSGEKNKAIELVLASSGKQRTQLEAFIKGLPVNASLGKELGDTGAETLVSAQAEVDKRVRKVQADARDAGKSISYAQARKQVLADDENLKTQLEEEQ
ncbi:phage protease [Glutamicibacter halophytocola]|uniref:phage protease n=1 Tax=Glutamicibacter halophytocola TaxID=1933880 RepID=UPI0015C57CA6|nr:phage protease [Glutamicibacter halophytocola]NQD39979.1 hypothetical protein [Glutamicibacter halophytocola]